VTDCPVALISYYAQRLGTPQQVKLFKDMYLTYLEMCNSKGHLHVNYLLERSRSYQTKGRYHTEKEALEIDAQVKQFMQECGSPLIEVAATSESIELIFKNLNIK
jgi:hypothetical protein